MGARRKVDCLHDTDTVLALTGASYRQLDHWCRRGLVDVPSRGSGRNRVWLPRHISKVHRMARLTDAGLTPDAAAKVAAGERELAPGVYVLVSTALEEA